MYVDIVFPLCGDDVPIDHGYALYSALSHVVAAFHDSASAIRFGPILGDPVSDGLLRLNAGSRLRLRLPGNRIREALPLAGRRLVVAGHPVRVGVPAVAALAPAGTLFSRLVTFKNAEEPDQFLATARTKVAEAGLRGEPSLPLVLNGQRAGEYRRRVVRVKGCAIVGYALLVSGLSDSDSLRLQEIGLGGRTRMGCGFFMPAREEE
jgi:CRISPR-associated protein Cas6